MLVMLKEIGHKDIKLRDINHSNQPRHLCKLMGVFAFYLIRVRNHVSVSYVNFTGACISFFRLKS